MINFCPVFYCTLSLTLESQKRLLLHFLTKFFKYNRQIFQNFRTASPRSMRGQELLKTKSGEFEMVLSLKVSVLVALVESPSNIARIFQAQQLSCCGFMHEKHPMSWGVCFRLLKVNKSQKRFFLKLHCQKNERDI